MRSYRIAALAAAVGGGFAGYAYGQQLGLSGVCLWVTLAALVLEAVLYLTCGFPLVRQSWPKWALAVSAVVPYLLYTAPLGLTEPSSIVLLAILAAAAVWWFDLIPERMGADLLLIAFLAAVYLARTFPALYPNVHERVPMSILGHLMWVRLGLVTLLNRNPPGIEFGFLPTAREWRIGAIHFLAFLPPAAAVMLLMDYGTFALTRGWWYKAPLGFVGIMLLVGASEEILFRGVLQQRLMRWWGQWPGLLAASVIFALVHLPFRHFPNWQHVALTFVLGLALGRAYVAGQGVRASMVAHALAVAAGRAIGL